VRVAGRACIGAGRGVYSEIRIFLVEGIAQGIKRLPVIFFKKCFCPPGGCPLKASGK
jgi:hypothetical protein